MKFINKDYIIGIDIGGSKINAIIFNDGKVLKSAKISTPKNRKEFLKELEALAKKLISEIDQKKILGIGCGIGGTLDLKKGTIRSWSNIKFLDEFNIKNWLEKKFNCKVRIDNDARCFTRAEYLFGSGRGYKNIVGITLGTGVGGGIIIDGKMIYGANDSAGEVGHIIIDDGKDLEFLTVKQIRKLKFSEMATKEFENNLGIGLASIINVLDPEVIIIGGGAANNAKFFLPKIRKIADKFIVFPKTIKNDKISIGKLGENAGAMGAAALFYEQ